MMSVLSTEWAAKAALLEHLQTCKVATLRLGSDVAVAAKLLSFEVITPAGNVKVGLQVSEQEIAPEGAFLDHGHVLVVGRDALVTCIDIGTKTGTW